MNQHSLQRWIWIMRSRFVCRSRIVGVDAAPSKYIIFISFEARRRDLLKKELVDFLLLFIDIEKSMGPSKEFRWRCATLGSVLLCSNTLGKVLDVTSAKTNGKQIFYPQYYVTKSKASERQRTLGLELSVDWFHKAMLLGKRVTVKDSGGCDTTFLCVAQRIDGYVQVASSTLAINFLPLQPKLAKDVLIQRTCEEWEGKKKG